MMKHAFVQIHHAEVSEMEPAGDAAASDVETSRGKRRPLHVLCRPLTAAAVP